MISDLVLFSDVQSKLQYSYVVLCYGDGMSFIDSTPTPTPSSPQLFIPFCS